MGIWVRTSQREHRTLVRHGRASSNEQVLATAQAITGATFHSGDGANGAPVVRESGLSPSRRAQLEACFRSIASGETADLLSIAVPATPTLPTGIGLPAFSSSGESTLDAWFSRPARAALAMVENMHAWSPTWGPRPESLGDALAEAADGLAIAPQPWPISHEAYEFSPDEGAGCLRVQRSQLSFGLTTGLLELRCHLGFDDELSWSTSIPQPWLDLVCARGVVRWWGWSAGDDVALAAGVDSARRLAGGVYLENFKHLSPSLAVNLLVRLWAQFVWDRERRLTSDSWDYNETIAVRDQIETVIAQSTRAAADKLRTMVEPFDIRFAGSQDRSMPRWWLARVPRDGLIT
jgi:hypothetical protein